MRIYMTNGLHVLVDARDAEVICCYRWWWESRKGMRYAFAWIGGANVSMHSFLMHPKRGLIVDHKNRDGLDNRRANLRTCKTRSNSRNSRAHTDSETGLKGVCFHSKARNKYVARGWDGKKRLYLGSYATAQEAHEAYVKWAKKAHGKYFRAA